MRVGRLLSFLLVLCSVVGTQIALAQPSGQDFEAAPSGPVSAVGPSSTYTLDGVTYSATYSNSDGQFVHPSDIGVFLTPQFLSLSAFNGEAQEVRISDDSGDEFKFNSMDVSFGNCGPTGSCNGFYALVAYRDGIAVTGSGQGINWAGDGPAVTFDVSSNSLWRNIDEIRVTKPGSSTAQRDFYMAIDNLDFAPAEIQVGGLVTGLVTSESVVLQNNGGDDLTVSADGSFSFPAPLAPGASYTVTVRIQPGPISETCTVANGSGTITNTDITNVAITCAINTFPVGGTLSGLAAGQSVALLNLGADTQTLTADGSFTFSAQADGSAYDVTIGVQPTDQTCSVANGSGTVAGSGISNVTVACVRNPTTPQGGIPVVYGPRAVPVMPIWLLGTMLVLIAGMGSIRIRRRL